MPNDAVESRSTWWLWSLLWQRCPRCRAGKMFRGRFAMNDPCPVCGLIFQREEGYFLGAMYTSYALSVAIYMPLYFIALALMPANPLLALGVSAVAYLPFVPAVFRYSRVLWVYFDRSMCPTDVSAGPTEKEMQRQISCQNRETIEEH
jgi:uncharacterized protein (DUF983 family)